jgi:transcriptional regulator with XRE-family HTH domain
VDAGVHLGFGDLLRQHRNAASLTQEDLAERAGLNPDTISLLERGERRPHRYTTQSLAEALGLSQRDRIRFEAAARPPPVSMPTALGGPPTSTRSPRPLSAAQGRWRR